MSLIVVSDLHVQDADDPVYHALIRLLDSRVKSGDTVVLAGDIFDLFVGGKRIFRERYNAFIEALRSASARGAEIHYIEGNHDFQLRGAFPGVRVHSEGVELEIGGKKFLIVHGDLADSKDYGYRALRIFWRCPPMRAFIGLAPGKWIDWIGKTSSGYSRNRKPILPGDLPIERRERLRKVYRSYAAMKIAEGFDFVVMGHCHDLDEMSFQVGGHSGQYINVGFPRVHGSFLSWSPRDEKIQREALPRALIDESREEGEKVHPWRLCSYGKHAVRTHPMHIEPSKNHPDGKMTRHYHCAFNRNRKDVLFPFEMELMAEAYFSSLPGPPKSDDLGFKAGNAYDDVIRGWTKYWNEVLKPHEALDPDLIKALIATESGFRPYAGIRSLKKKAKGLMQLIPQTTEILRDEHGELKDHFVSLSKEDVGVPCFNVSAGIRWLFRKHETASSKLGRIATWDEAVAEYKFYLKDMNNPQMVKFRKYYQRLKT